MMLVLVWLGKHTGKRLDTDIIMLDMLVATLAIT